MPIAQFGAPQHGAPIYARRELYVHTHRTSPGITPAERMLVCVFLRRYLTWCAKARRFDRLRDAADLLLEVAATGWGHRAPDR